MRWMAAGLCAACIASASWGQPAPLRFNRDVRPILSGKCFQCHGPDKNNLKAGLRLDDPAGATADRHGVRAIAPGDAAASELVRRIESADPEEVMPPPASGKTLSAAERETLKRWIAEGAAYEAHWAFIAPQRTAPPREAANPIDAFIAAGLDAKGLAPVAEADRVTLCRRLYLDLLGVPPTPAEAESFVNDTRPDAYAQLVETLLASPHYGERMALRWLDYVRYADTNGYHGDEFRTVWPYRDWVIAAFNGNMPFDRFTAEQLAGDLLPGAATAQKIASAYNRLNQLTAEGGAQPKEYTAIYQADRIRTTASVWLGLTMNCCQCHDHKYDPLTMRDFYSLGAFFADIEERAVYTAGGPWDPVMPLPSPDQQARMDAIDAESATVRAALDAPTPELEAAQAAWEIEQRALSADPSAGWAALRPSAASSANGTALEVLDDGSVLASGENPPQEVYTLAFTTEQAGITGLLLEALRHRSLANDALSRGNGNFVLSGIEVEVNGAPAAIASAVADYEQPNWPVKGAIDGDANTGWAVSGHEKRNESRSAVFAFAQPVAGGPGTSIVVRLRHESFVPQHVIGRARLSLSSASSPTLPKGADLPAGIAAILAKDPAARTPEEAAQIASHYRSIAPALQPMRGRLAQLDKDREALKKEIPAAMVSVSLAEPRTVRVLPRGNWMDDSGEVVQPATPAVLNPLPVQGRRATRLDLAQWMTAPENPLTARVFANRLWAQYFGTALSKVQDDLGSQGEPPSHPELLDWLAVEFVESGWDVKHMVRLMTTSETYRRSAQGTPALAEADPANRLLARQSRFRLPAELVRDSVLSVAGLLSPKMGGRSVFPYQPEGYWDSCNTFTGPLVYTADAGEDQYRRGLYTVWKRTFLHPSMLAFDAPTREECTAERTRSNTPLQALALLNDPSYVEAARAFAERIYREGGSAVSDRLDWAYRRALSRPADQREAALLAALLEKHYNAYRQDPAAAAALLTVGQAPAPQDIDAAELAAWTSVARAILNLHETITRS